MVGTPRWEKEVGGWMAGWAVGTSELIPGVLGGIQRRAAASTPSPRVTGRS